MKFGHNLPCTQVPEWASAYIDYKGLKKLIKAAEKSVKLGQEPDLAEFFYILDRNVEDVDDFYAKKYAEVHRRLKLINDRYGDITQLVRIGDRDELEELNAALVELRDLMRKLQWYGEVNRRGFVKITKKLDKKIPSSKAQQRYLETKVDTRPFARYGTLSDDLKAVNASLAALSAVEAPADNASIKSSTSMSLKRRPSISTVELPEDVIAALDEAIRKDDDSVFPRRLFEAYPRLETADPAFQRLLLHFLQRSISCKAKKCMVKLLDKIDSLDEEDDINHRNCIHRLAIATGRPRVNGRPQSSAVGSVAVNGTATGANRVGFATPLTGSSESVDREYTAKENGLLQVLLFLLQSLQPHHKLALKARDIDGRLPIHYAAQFGIASACDALLSCTDSRRDSDGLQDADALQAKDNDGYTPLHLAVMGGHHSATNELLKAGNWLDGSADGRSTAKGSSTIASLLLVATKSNFASLVELLLTAGFDVDYQDDQGETALHIAAHFGYAESAKVLLSSSKKKANTEIVEKTFGWTPLFVACVEGHIALVELLLETGAIVQGQDVSGWTPKEHAAFRGHLDVVRKLTEVMDVQGQPDLTHQPPESPETADTQALAVNEFMKTEGQSAPKEPVKTFGHRYLKDQSIVLVSLGTLDPRKQIQAVDMESSPLAEGSDGTSMDTSLSVVVSASGATGEPLVVDLPLEETVSTSPVAFHTSDLTKVKIYFDIVATSASSKTTPLARGVAVLSTVKPGIGSRRMSLQGDLSVPVVAAHSLNVIGKVNFNFLVINSFEHPNLAISKEQTYWKQMGQTTVIGHRGLGKNISGRKSLQLGENTIQSFISAASLGATYVEFDVQLTKDHVPVIYHDFLVSETGIDAPVHALTLDQFLHITDATTPRESQPTSPNEPSRRNGDSGFDNSGRRNRSYSFDSDAAKTTVNERLKHTRDFKLKGFKANSRGSFIQAPFTTLEEMFKKLPESIGFNIEMKYPMLFESEEQEMDTYAVELNSFVDTVLTKVYDLYNTRHVIFSSFNPDICLLLSLKQPSIPVLFLTDAGASPVGDIRASSLQEAIRFATRWNLLGVVSAAEPLVQCPRLVRAVKESGLVCVSYGSLNNDPKNVRLQVKEGIDAVIVDNVLAIRKGLTDDEVQGSTAREVTDSLHTPSKVAA